MKNHAKYGYLFNHLLSIEKQNIMKTIYVLFTSLVLSIQLNAQNVEPPTAEQQAEWRRIAQEEGQKSVASNTVKNFFRNKLIFLVIGGAVALVGGAVAVSTKDKKN